jgi:hypothetical protein
LGFLALFSPFLGLGSRIKIAILAPANAGMKNMGSFLLKDRDLAANYTKRN